MQVKLDEDLSQSVGRHVSGLGYQVKTVIGQGWGGVQDDELWPRVVAEQIYWITADNGFGDVRLYKPGTHSGILLLRPDEESIAAYIALIEKVVAKHPLETLTGALTVVSPRSIRIRRP